jgi:hypothetical protein
MFNAMPPKTRKPLRAPRIRVPNSERALFNVDDSKFVGIIHRLSLTGGSAILTKGPIPLGTPAVMNLQTVFGKVTAQIEFLQTGADGVPLAQAFRFIAMSKVSEERFRAAAEQMQRAGFSDAVQTQRLFGSESLQKLRESIRRLSGVLTVPRRA